MSKQFVNNVASVAILATCWHEVPMPPLEGEVPNEREAEGFVRKLSKKTPQSARSGCQLPFQGSQGGFAARVARLATPTLPILLLTMRSIFSLTQSSWHFSVSPPPPKIWQDTQTFSKMTTRNRLSASLTKISPLCYNRGEDMFSTLHAHRE